LTQVLPDLVEIRFPKRNDFDYRAGQFVRIAVPKISIWEFHSITFSSAPQEPYVKLHIKVLGDWSNQLLELASSEEEKPKDIIVFLDGPYGSSSVDLDNDKKYQMVLMVSGGVGVTPCQSITKSLLLQHKGGRRLSKIRYIWAVRDFNMVQVLSPFPESNEHERDSNAKPYENSASSIIVTENKKPSEPTETTQLVSHEEEKKEDELENGYRKEHSSGLILNENKLPMQMDVFLTRKKLNVTDNCENVMEQKKYSSDQLSLSNKVALHHGRPDLDAIFMEVRDEALQYGYNYVAVVACGPAPLVDKVKKLCLANSTCELLQCCGITFDLHEEVFEY